MAEETTTGAVGQPSDKRQSKESVSIRAAQTKAGKVKLNERKEYEIIKDGKHVVKGEKVQLNAATAEVFRAKKLIK